MSDFEIECDRPNLDTANQKLLWCPFAEISKNEMPTRGTFKNNYPKYVVVHYTAGRSMRGDTDSINCIKYGIKQGYAYFCLSRIGTLFQTHALNKWGWHAGNSKWNDDVGLNKYSIGIEINCSGRLKKVGEKYFTCYGEEIPPNEVRYSKNHDNIIEGYYHKYTEAQEDALIKFLLWMKRNNNDFDLNNVVGHDEIKVPHGGKQDPGASLSMTMPEFRKLLIEKYNDL
jgi:N-acetyl-anhydromuramyl-L-alanine amidase AmpD